MSNAYKYFNINALSEALKSGGKSREVPSYLLKSIFGKEGLIDELSKVLDSKKYTAALNEKEYLDSIKVYLKQKKYENNAVGYIANLKDQIFSIKLSYKNLKTTNILKNLNKTKFLFRNNFRNLEKEVKIKIKDAKTEIQNCGKNKKNKNPKIANTLKRELSDVNSYLSLTLKGMKPQSKYIEPSEPVEGAYNNASKQVESLKSYILQEMKKIRKDLKNDDKNTEKDKSKIEVYNRIDSKYILKELTPISSAYYNLSLGKFLPPDADKLLNKLFKYTNGLS